MEAIRSETNIEEVAKPFFIGKEVAELHNFSVNMRNEAFFFAGRAKRHISRPAAAGLTFRLTVLKFRSHPENPSCSQSNDSNRWDLRSFEPADGYVGAVVTEKNPCEIRFWDWQFYSPSYY